MFQVAWSWMLKLPKQFQASEYCFVRYWKFCKLWSLPFLWECVTLFCKILTLNCLHSDWFSHWSSINKSTPFLVQIHRRNISLFNKITLLDFIMWLFDSYILNDFTEHDEDECALCMSYLCMINTREVKIIF